MSQNTPHGSSYDVVVVGAGIAGSAFAHALSAAAFTSRTAPLRIALLERSLAEPDRIVGELLQPGGVAALRELGLGACLDGIDAVPVHGFAVLDAGETVHIPYPSGAQGRSFHHGRFIQNLRAHAKAAPGVDVIETTVTDLIEWSLTRRRRVIGVRARRARSWRVAHSSRKMKGHGPVLLYQIGKHDTRILMDVKNPLPISRTTFSPGRVGEVKKIEGRCELICDDRGKNVEEGV